MKMLGPAAARSAASKEIIMGSNNVGKIDRVLRVIAGLVLIGLSLSGTIGLWGWIGLVPLVTGALGTCPMYKLVGLSTCPLDANRKKT
jgi:hypothetical protein